jgi:phenylacetic acid degradation operon negative regulatory protein
MLQFGRDAVPWNGSWTVVLFSVPEERRETRHVVRTRLRSLGLAPLYDGVWVSPRTRPHHAAAALNDLGFASATVFAAELEGSVNDGHPLNAWDLDAIGDRYEAFIERFAPLMDRAARGEVAGTEALVSRTELMNAWCEFPILDPELPKEVLPSRWPRPEAQHVFAASYDALGPPAQARFQEILAAHEPRLATRVRYLTTTTVSRPPR